MLDRYVVTINFNDWMVDNVRQSQQAAAQRWGAEYLEMTQPWGSRSDVFGAKLDLAHLPVPHDAQVIYLDGDVLVRDDCPSLFDRVPLHRFGGVCSEQGDTACSAYHADWCRRVGQELGIDGQYRASHYFNGGVLVFCPSIHGEIWEATARRVSGALNPMFEQTAMALWLWDLGLPSHILPREYNRIGTVPWTVDPMACYVYHMANFKRHREGKRERLAAVDWRVPGGL